MGTPQHRSVTLLLLRHGLTAATGTVLAGRAPGLHLDERGREQAERAARRLAGLPVDAVVTSPLERCAETAEPVARALGAPVRTDSRFAECDYGEWTGRTLEELAEESLWPVVQAHPSAARFPGGESLAGMSARAVEAVRDWSGRLLAGREEPRDPVLLVCTHGDVIKALAADALGLHLDLFQRIQADPCSVTAIRYTPMRPFLLRLNDVGETAEGLAPPEEVRSDAVVGGGAGRARA
ncbi:MSMEG_4193 family putative phosphomutase [Nocardiopsis potens]|uniref:MSMEG_4193 family putative phosphomutase n=1 Tax=Nocardiopsis potens TaxID=1246458 RepID=UPI000349E643|nr:MSMEG_4193 family putative phosphomutase [Nocardiopsis potens]